MLQQRPVVVAAFGQAVKCQYPHPIGDGGKVKLFPHTLCNDARIRLHGIWAEALVMARLLFAEHDDSSLTAARSMNGRTRLVERRTGR